MKLLKLTIGVAALALGIASAASNHTVKVYDAVTINGTDLQPGEYTIVMQGNMVQFKAGKKMVEFPATTANNDKKYTSTALVTEGKKLIEIDLGGTTEKIVFGGAVQAAK